jgi:hypothetical protein
VHEQPQNPVLSRFGCEITRFVLSSKYPSPNLNQHGIVVPSIFKHAKNVVKQETIGILYRPGGGDLYILYNI